MIGLHRLKDEQRDGVDPAQHVWLRASAGTGKTQVLSGRVLRLLLDDHDGKDGVAPQSILCITYTKAGAAEMARRVRTTLARWVQASDADLDEDLFKIGAKRDAATMQRARRLFARVIDAPGQGLAIQTIHSFCQSLLGSFPIEAGLTPGFRLIDGREELELRREVLTDLITSAQGDGHPAFLVALQSLALLVDETAVIDYLFACSRAAPAMQGMTADGEGVDDWLRDRLELPPGDPLMWAADRCTDAQCPPDAVAQCSVALRAWGTPTGQNSADVLDYWQQSGPAERVAQLEYVRKVVGTIPKGASDFALKALWTGNGQCVAAEASAQTLLDHWHKTLTTLRQLQRLPVLVAGLEAGRHFARGYADAKRRRGYADFDDLITRTVLLLEFSTTRDWIRFKLDQRIDHLLLDEAQDTNAAQWAIINALTDEFFAGAGAKDDTLRTLFVVGDYKQAIYGFQGTNPQSFEDARVVLAEKAALAVADGPRAPRLVELDIATSFRSSPVILELVDAVIDDLGSQAMGLPDDAVPHHPAAAAGGRVVLWPAEPAVLAGVDDDGDNADATDSTDDADERLADKIARTVRGWVAHGIDGTVVRAGDVMVLLRQRGSLARLLVARLQARGVAVAGVDRMRLRTPLVVQDLIAAARFAVQPLDDLNLASLLVSPLFGWSQDDLWTFGHRDDHTSLWRHLRGQTALKERLGGLYALLGMADFVTPYRFFETILSGPLQGRARLLARLGPAAQDPLEELVSAALTFETGERASLHRFLAWFDGDDSELKRESDAAPDEARVMTVHGAKGLEARIVILADTTSDPTRRKAAASVNWRPGQGQSVVPLLRGAREDRPDALTAAIGDADAADLREHYRLLYVALTRARRMLFVTGKLGKRPDKDTASGAPKLSWYDQIDRTMAGMGAHWTPTGDDWTQARQLIARGVVPADRDLKARAVAVPVVIPVWARTVPAAEPRPPRPLAPSSMEDVAVLAVPSPPLAAGDVGTRARLRGTLVHALFERLPDAEPAQREGAAARWLGAQGAMFDDAERGAMLASVLMVLDDPAHAALFGPESRAEVPFSALVDGRVIAGTIDRLVVTRDAVRVIDYKTGGVPGSLDAIPAGYLRQMWAYRAALKVIFPGRTVEAALLFTDGPRLFDLPEALLEAHAPGLLTATKPAFAP